MSGGPVPAMKTLPRPNFWRLSSLLATGFGVGLLPKAPGTWGSLAALPCAWLIVWAGGPIALACAAAAAFGLGWWASEIYAKGRSDPGEVVIDEVAGQWLVLIAAPLDFGLYALGFVLFRLADITKPWPANWAERRLPGGLGIMADDSVAGVYAGVALWAAADLVMR